jgi:sugar phosphate isomerase/epimerase
VRLRHPGGRVVHLAYCSNVHPADDIDGVCAQLERYAARVRERLDAPVLGVGLWLAAPALADPGAAGRLRALLDRLGLEVVTLNGFPYRAFHAEVVKRDVYRPSWAEPERGRYTVALARLLAELLPGDVEEGSISTLPLGWREGWDASAQAAARAELEAVARELERIAGQTGKRIRLAVEPEPGCTVETVEQACAVLGGLDPEWIGLCLDACHLAVQFEAPGEALAALAGAGVPVVKLQVSSALRVPEPGGEAARELLSRFAEPRFLHQVRERRDGAPAAVDDLPEALGGGLPGEDEWRVHFHVPVQHAEHTTQEELATTLAAVMEGPATRHLEVETYTWSVLPDGPRDDDGLVAGLAGELAWTRDRLQTLGMEVVA